MKSLGITLVTLTVIALLGTACKKSKTKSITDLLTQSSWKFDNASVGGADVSFLLDSCSKDNILTFKSDGSGVEDEGATKCNSGDPQSTNFTWNFANGDSVLHASASLLFGGNGDFNIKGLTETQMLLSQNVTLSGVTQEAIVAFRH